MALTIEELAFMVDSKPEVCITDEVTGAVSFVIKGLQVRVGSGPVLKDVVGNGATPDEARTNFATKVRNQVVVVGGNPRGVELRIPNSIIGFEPAPGGGLPS